MTRKRKKTDQVIETKVDMMSKTLVWRVVSRSVCVVRIRLSRRLKFRVTSKAHEPGDWFVVRPIDFVLEELECRHVIRVRILYLKDWFPAALVHLLEG